MNTNLKEISNFIKKNNSYSDFNLVDNFLLNLNFTKINFKKNLIGGYNDIYQQTDYTNLPQQTDYTNLPQQTDYTNLPQQTDYTNLPQQTDYSMIPQQTDYTNLPQQTDYSMIPQQTDYSMIPQQTDNIQKLPDMYLQNPSFTTDQIDTYTIKEGTILYHATSNKKGFNTNYLNLGQDKLINFFTPNFRLASDKIEGCSIDKQNGYIHVFRVIKDIPNIFVRLPYDIANDINSGLLADEFCSSNQNYYGIGFFYPKNNIEMFSNNISRSDQLVILDNQDQYYSEFGLCNPKPYLEYLYSQRCQSLRKLSDPYRFN